MRDIFTQLVSLVKFHRMGRHPQLDFVEYCAGSAAVTFGVLREGLRTAAFDVVYSASHDMHRAAGLRRWIFALATVKSRGLIWYSSSCVFIA